MLFKAVALCVSLAGVGAVEEMIKLFTPVTKVTDYVSPLSSFFFFVNETVPIMLSSHQLKMF